MVGSSAMSTETSIDCVYFSPPICSVGASVKFRAPRDRYQQPVAPDQAGAARSTAPPKSNTSVASP